MSDYKNLKYTLPIKWQSSIKTGDFTAVSGEGYFINTTSAAVTITLPASPSVGDFVGIIDYARTFGTNKCVIGANSSNIEGSAADNALKTNGASATLVYGDATKGWAYVQQSDVGDLNNAEFVAATGGTITTSGDYKIHTFTSSGTFTVTSAGNACGSNTVDYMVVAGGAGGSTTSVAAVAGGGGGAGGFRESVPSPAAWTASPLANPGGGLTVSAQGYPITVGAGGAAAPAGPSAPHRGSSGNPSTFSTITSAGGGGGGFYAGNNPPDHAGTPGGSGGGGTRLSTANGGTGNSPPVSPPQGNDGGDSNNDGGAGGGGAGAKGNEGDGNNGGPGGNGVTTNINASPVARAGGGGGGSRCASNPTGGTGGGGNGGYDGPPAGNATSGTANTGGGGGSTSTNTTAGSGGSGIVILRYKFQ